MGILEKYLKDIKSVKQMRQDVSNLKDELIDILRKHDGKKREDHSLKNRILPAGEMEEVL